MARIARRLVPAALGLALIASASPVTGHELGWRWREYHLIGDCGGIKTGRYVKHLQAILWAAKDLSQLTDIDGDYGSTTRAALKDFQRFHGLVADGCAGPSTLKRMQKGRHWNNRYRFYYHHMRFLGATDRGPATCMERWQWREKNFDRFARFRYWGDAECKRSDNPDPDPNCWIFVKAVNRGNNNMLKLNRIIEHDGDNGCGVANAWRYP